MDVSYYACDTPRDIPYDFENSLHIFIGEEGKPLEILEGRKPINLVDRPLLFADKLQAIELLKLYTDYGTVRVWGTDEVVWDFEDEVSPPENEEVDEDE